MGRKSLEQKLRGYPKIGQLHQQQLTKERHEFVCICGNCVWRNHHYYTVDIQWDFFRGNDDVVKVCKYCGKAHERGERKLSLAGLLKRCSDG